MRRSPESLRHRYRVVETLLAGWVLSHARLSSPGGMMTIAPCRPKDQVHVNANGTLRGRVRHIPFARETEHIAVLVHSPKGLQVALVRTSDCLCTDGRSLAGDTVSDVTLDNVRPVDLSPVQQGLDQSKVMMMGAVLRALQTAAALQVILQMATQYAQNRVAFGKPIGKFQAVQHNLARLAGEASAALTAAGSAAEAIAAIDGDPARFDEGVYLEAASARIRCAEAATEGASIAHQVFGAIGFTKEHVLHRFTMRLLAWRDDFGNESQWALDLGTRIAAKGADELWPLMASR